MCYDKNLIFMVEVLGLPPEFVCLYWFFQLEVVLVISKIGENILTTLA